MRCTIPRDQHVHLLWLYSIVFQLYVLILAAFVASSKLSILSVRGVIFLHSQRTVTLWCIISTKKRKKREQNFWVSSCNDLSYEVDNLLYRSTFFFYWHDILPCYKCLLQLLCSRNWLYQTQVDRIILDIELLLITAMLQRQGIGKSMATSNKNSWNTW